MKKTSFTSDTIVAFHISKKGLSFLGAHPIGDYTDGLFSPIKLDPDDPDGYLDDDDPEAEWKDCSGNGVELTNAMVTSGIGTINIDCSYNTTYTKKLGEVDEKEIEAIEESNEYDADEALLFLGIE